MPSQSVTGSVRDPASKNKWAIDSQRKATDSDFWPTHTYMCMYTCIYSHVYTNTYKCIIHTQSRKQKEVFDSAVEPVFLATS